MNPIKTLPLAPALESELKSLVSLIEMAERALILCLCNEPALRGKLIDKLEERLRTSGIGLIRLRMEKGVKPLIFGG